MWNRHSCLFIRLSIFETNRPAIHNYPLKVVIASRQRSLSPLVESRIRERVSLAGLHKLPGIPGKLVLQVYSFFPDSK